jgi:outer membrane receptor protein involved in Fe transport
MFIKRKLIAAGVTLGMLPMVSWSAALEEIIVTAQKRSQDINDVGMSVSAATGDQLAALGVTDVGDLVKVTPGMTYTVSQNGTPLFTLRGVGFNDYTLGASPAVSVYVDEVPLAYGAFTKGVSMDLERVEVLKGPQGILFGQNSTGGAINYIAAKPTQEFEAGVKGSYGRFNRFETEGFISGGLSDTVSGRVAMSVIQADEWQKSSTSDQELGAEDVFKGRVQLMIEPSDVTTMLIGLNGWVDKSDTQAAQRQGLALQVPSAAGSGLDETETARRISVFQALPNDANKDPRVADWDQDRDLERDDNFYQFSFRLDHEISESLTFTSITSYSEYEENYSMDRDATNLENSGIDSIGEVESFMQELRLTGTGDSMNWVVGANYATNDVKLSERILTTDSTNTALIPGGPWIGDSQTDITQDITDFGVFANVEYDITDATALLVGARYAENENDFSSCLIGNDLGMRLSFPLISDIARAQAPSFYLAGENECLTLDNATFALTSTPTTDTLDEDNVSWRIGLNHNATEDLLLYGLVSKGYKTGSFPVVPASNTNQLGAVGQESVLAYELGFKWSMESSQFNGAIFNYEYEDKQVRGIVLDPVFNQLDRLVNIPESSIQGVEFDLTTSPVDGLVLRFSGTYVDSEVDEFYSFIDFTGTQQIGINGARVQGDFAGSELPYTPDVHLVADLDYSWGISDSLNAFVGANMTYNSEANSTFGDAESTTIDSFSTLDVRAGIESADGAWNVALWGRNVTDEEYWTNQFFTQDVISRVYAKPVTYGVSFGYNFQ